MAELADLLALLTRDPPGSALLLDFDGTLAPIVDDPATSAMPDPIAGVVEDLSHQLGVVAVVSGRPAAFLGERVRLPRVQRLGLYGLQAWTEGGPTSRPEALAWQPQVDRAREILEHLLGGLEGVLVEDKGLSVAVHWRNAADRALAEHAVEEAARRLASDSGLQLEPGKLVVELRPPVPWDKGSTVRAVVEELNASAVAYIGDDLGDLPAFEAVRELGGLAVAVEHGSETAPEVREAADLLLQGPDAVGVALTALRDQLEGRSGSTASASR